MTTYTYTIFDSDPNASDGGPWPHRSDVELEADSDQEAIDAVLAVMSSEAESLYPSDGYSAGDTLYALVWDSDGMVVGSPTYELTHDDLGTEPAESTEARLARAANHISAVKIDADTWAHYADETSLWYCVSSDDLESLCDYLDDPDTRISSDAYSHWCAGANAEEMPEGWEP